MSQTQTAMVTVQKTDKKKKGLRRALKKWRDGLKTNNKPLSPPLRASTTAPQISTPVGTPTPSVQLPPAGQPQADGVALFKPTTQTHIHSPLDKRNKTSNSSSPASTLRRSVLGSRRNTAPADYFALSTVGPSERKDPWSDIVAPTAETVERPTKQSRRSSKLRFSFSKRASVVQQQTPTVTRTITPQPLISPVPSAPSPAGHENGHCTFQYTTAAEIAALAKANEESLVDASEVIKRDRPKDWLNPGWRELEKLEVERKLAQDEIAMNEELERMGSVKLKSGECRTDVLRRWEWGR
ncbi:hypothetical protein BKA66DRAFT_107934 [Pyrenochaeta sp. MPI-SDFR-AT-0127]|nr:hypothetical protein BKA66DRAFT_107934 [Pyrenochaeta sp. MPI-SDFR-AT-0127]